MLSIAIVGYGNVGKGVEKALDVTADMSLYGIFTKRPVEAVSSPFGNKVFSVSDIGEHQGNIDIALLCGGSATELPTTTADMLAHFSTVDSFDNHSQMQNYLEGVGQAATKHRRVAICGAGWDPGIFSVFRVISSAFGDDGCYTFYGPGVSQGHSEAIRGLSGVTDAVQFTLPVELSLDMVLNGEKPKLTAFTTHRRDCYVAVKEGVDFDEIALRIKTMPDYFLPYDTTVTEVTAEEVAKLRAGMPHSGRVIHGTKKRAELSLKLDSNPEFTAQVMIAHARAVGRLLSEGKSGVFTPVDIAPSYLSPLSREEIIGLI